MERKEFRGRLDLQVGSRRLIFEEINSRIEGPRGDPGDKGERGYEGVKGTKAGLAHKHQTSFTHPDPRFISRDEKVILLPSLAVGYEGTGRTPGTSGDPRTPRDSGL